MLAEELWILFVTRELFLEVVGFGGDFLDEPRGIGATRVTDGGSIALSSGQNARGIGLSGIVGLPALDFGGGDLLKDLFRLARRDDVLHKAALDRNSEIILVDQVGHVSLNHVLNAAAI